MKNLIFLLLMLNFNNLFAYSNLPEIKLTNQKVDKIEVPDPRAIVDTYFLWGSSKSKTFSLPKSDLISCKEHSAFWELIKVIEFKKLFAYSKNDIFPFAAGISCIETTKSVILESVVGLYSLSTAGNKILAEYTEAMNGKMWLDNTIFFQKPRYEIIRHVIAVESGDGADYKWTEASYYEELNLGYNMQSGYDASVRFKKLMETNSPNKAVELFLGEKVKNSQTKNELLKVVPSANNIHYFYTVLKEFEKYPYDSSTNIDFYGFGNQLFAVSYLCQPDCKEIDQFRKPLQYPKSNIFVTTP